MTTHPLKWLRVPGFPDYEISENGRVRRIKSASGTRAGLLLKPSIAKRGNYLMYGLYKDGHFFCTQAGRLVALAFIGPPPSPKHEVAHNDGNASNNHYKNLRWATSKENHADRYKHGRIGKLKAEDVKAIRHRLQQRHKLRAIAEDFGVSYSLVYLISRSPHWTELRGEIRNAPSQTNDND
jgi:hypothetical protein